MEDKPITISSKPLHGPQPQSPEIPDEPGLKVAILPAVTDAGQPTVALFASALVCGRHAQIYGGRAASAVQIVAIANDTGEVYHNTPERGHAVPLSTAMKADPAPPKAGQATIDSVEVQFAVDLQTQLHLPARSSTYSVFLWLDEITSDCKQVEIRGAESNAAASSRNIPSIVFRLLEGKPNAGASEVLLNESGRRFAGEVGAELFAKLKSRNVPSYVSILALDYRSRTFNGISAPLPRDTRPGNLLFGFSGGDLVSGPGWLDAGKGTRKAFVLAAVGGVLSQVLVLQT